MQFSRAQVSKFSFYSCRMSQCTRYVSRSWSPVPCVQQSCREPTSRQRKEQRKKSVKEIPPQPVHFLSRTRTESRRSKISADRLLLLLLQGTMCEWAEPKSGEKKKKKTEKRKTFLSKVGAASVQQRRPAVASGPRYKWIIERAAIETTINMVVSRPELSFPAPAQSFSHAASRARAGRLRDRHRHRRSAGPLHSFNMNFEFLQRKWLAGRLHSGIPTQEIGAILQSYDTAGAACRSPQRTVPSQKLFKITSNAMQRHTG